MLLKATFYPFLFIFIGIVLMVPQLSGLGMNADEMLSMIYAKSIGPQALFWDNTPPVYYILLKLWSFLAGSSAESARIMNLLIALSYPVLGFRIADKFFGRPQAIIAGFLFVLSSVHIRYTFEIRSYVLFELLSIWNLYFFLLSFHLKKITKGYWISILALLGTHYLSLFLVLSHAIIFALEKQTKVRYRTWVYIMILSFGLVLIQKINLQSLTHLDFDQLNYFSNLQTLKDHIFTFISFAFLIAFFIFVRKPKYLILDKLFIFTISTFIFSFLVFKKNPYFEKYIIFLVPILLLRLSDFIVSSGRKIGVVIFVCYVLINGVRIIQQYKKPHSGWAEAIALISQSENPTLILDHQVDIRNYYDTKDINVVFLKDLPLTRFSKQDHVFLVSRPYDYAKNPLEIESLRRKDMGIYGLMTFEPLQVIRYSADSK